MRTFHPITGSLLALVIGLILSPGVAVAQQSGTGQAVAGAPAVVNEAFTMERFQALQAAGALILIDVSAEWCTTCARQHSILAAFQEQYPNVPLNRLTVDFDDQKRYVRHLRAPRQSTLFLYVGNEQVWFSVAETNAQRIFAAINEAAATP